MLDIKDSTTNEVKEKLTHYKKSLILR